MFGAAVAIKGESTDEYEDGTEDSSSVRLRSTVNTNIPRMKVRMTMIIVRRRRTMMKVTNTLCRVHSLMKAGSSNRRTSSKPPEDSSEVSIRSSPIEGNGKSSCQTTSPGRPQSFRLDPRHPNQVRKHHRKNVMYFIQTTFNKDCSIVTLGAEISKVGLQSGVGGIWRFSANAFATRPSCFPLLRNWSFVNASASIPVRCLELPVGLTWMLNPTDLSAL